VGKCQAGHLGHRLLSFANIPPEHNVVFNFVSLWLSLIVLSTLILHFCIITQVDHPFFDEIHYVSDARRIIVDSTTDRLEHPPLAKLIIVAGEYIFSGFKSPEQDTE
jgi:dolichyl-phosphate-mannose--protein O-mannosyl transferase